MTMSTFRKKPDPKPGDDAASLALRWQSTKSPADFRALRESLESVIDSGIKSFAGGDQAYRIPAYRLMQEAISTWKPGMGAAPATHVFNRLRELQRVRGDREYVLHIPERQRNLQIGVKRFTEDFAGENGREPTMDEVSCGMGVQRGVLKSMHRDHALVPESALSGTSDSGEAYTGDVSLPDDPQERWKEYVYDELGQQGDTRGQFVMENAMGFGGRPQMSQTDIASKLGISNPAVSKRIKVLESRLRENPLLRS